MELERQRLRPWISRETAPPRSRQEGAPPSYTSPQFVKKALQSSRHPARRDPNLFSAAICVWLKTLLSPQTCELAVRGPHKSPAQAGFVGRRGARKRTQFSPQVETEGSGLCADEVRCHGLFSPGMGLCPRREIVENTFRQSQAAGRIQLPAAWLLSLFS